jgi:hypothetical protein
LICSDFIIKFVLFLFQQLLDALRCPASTIVRAPWRAEFVLVPKEESCRKMDELVKVKKRRNVITSKCLNVEMSQRLNVSTSKCLNV